MFKPTGIQASVITPFDDHGNFMEEAYRKHLSWLIDTGIHGIAIGANTGEFINMTFEELKEVVLVGLDEAKGRVPITIGAIAPGLRTNLEIVKWAKEVGVAAALVQAPYYLAPPLGEDLYDYFKEIGSVGLPMVLFNHIHKTKYNLMPEVLEHLFDIETFVSMKETDPNMENNTLKLECLQAHDRTYLMSEEYNLFTHYMLGGDGSFPAAVNVAPELEVSLWNNCQSGNVKEALKEHRKLCHLGCILDGQNYPRGIKEGMKLIGREGGVTRNPIGEISDVLQNRIERELQSILLIK